MRLLLSYSHSMQAAEEVLEEPKIFSGLSAWFSDSVQQSRKEAWISCGGRLVNFDEAQFVFSEDFEAEDTEQLYKTKAFWSESLTVFHAMYIEDCISAGQMKAVDIGYYVLPPAPVCARLKELLQSQGGEHYCMYKWEAVNCSICSSRQKTKTSDTVPPAAPSDRRAPSGVELFTDVNEITSPVEIETLEQPDYDELEEFGYMEIETLEQPDYDELEEFVIGSNGAEIFLKEQ